MKLTFFYETNSLFVTTIIAYIIISGERLNAVGSRQYPEANFHAIFIREHDRLKAGTMVWPVCAAVRLSLVAWLMFDACETTETTITSVNGEAGDTNELASPDTSANDAEVGQIYYKLIRLGAHTSYYLFNLI